MIASYNKDGPGIQNFLETSQFLKALDEDDNLFTFETIEEPKPMGRSTRIKRYHDTFEKVQDRLLQDNSSGSGVFVVVNATDGQGRKKENITRIRAVFVDLDGSPLGPVLQAPLSPHIVIQSSPDRYHAYWMVHEMPLNQFEHVQKALATRYAGDPSVCDLPRLMRLPGFLHLKKGMFCAHIIKSSGTKPYSFEILQNAFGLSNAGPPISTVTGATNSDQESSNALLTRLQERGLTKRYENTEGRWLIRCPWANEHTTGDENAHYFVQGSNGYFGDGFKCFHSHCANRDIHSLRAFLGLQPKQGMEPLPLYREIPSALPFPVEALGSVLAPAALALHQSIKAPLAMIAQSLLGAVSLVAQAHANVKLDGRDIALSLFMITVAESGERKSAVDDMALAAILKWQRQLCQVYNEEYRAYEAAHETWRNRKKGQDQSIYIEEPTAPIKPIILIEEPTYEGLVKYLEGGQPSIGLFSDEGGRFLGGSAMNRDNLLKTLSGLSSLWDAKPDKPITRIRSGDKSLSLYGRRVAMHLMIQESVYSQLNQQSISESQGFLPRCLITFPESTTGKRPYASINPAEIPQVTKYWDFCNQLLDRKLPTAAPPSPVNQLEPPSISLSAEARSFWIKFHDELEKELGEHGRYHAIRRFGSKAAEYVLRVAGSLAVFEDPTTTDIQVTYIERAALIIDYYLNERIRLESYHCIDSRLLTAQKVVEWAISKGKQKVGLRELYQLGPQEVRSKDKALAIMAILESHGRAIPIPANELHPDTKGKAWYLFWPDKPMELANPANPLKL